MNIQEIDSSQLDDQGNADFDDNRDKNYMFEQI